jgi:hypothetical protein
LKYIKEKILIKIAIAQTAISDNTMRIPNNILGGKSNKKPASAIGVQSTKKLHVTKEATPPVKRSYW